VARRRDFRRVVPALARARDDPHPWAQLTAHNSLGRLTGNDRLPRQKKEWLRWWKANRDRFEGSGDIRTALPAAAVSPRAGSPSRTAWPVLAVRNADGFFLAYGRGDGARSGELLEVYRIPPDEWVERARHGEWLDIHQGDQRICRLKVNLVMQYISRAVLLEGDAPAEGDMARRPGVAAPTPPPSSIETTEGGG